LGFRVVDALGAAHHIALRENLPIATYGVGTIGTHQVILAKPLTHMNASGKAVAGLCAHFPIHPRDLMVVHDDLDLTLGRVKLKTQGGDAGHYGVRSIIDHLGTGEFTRIRVGIGRPVHKDEVIAFVLSPFTPDEIPLVDEAVRHAMEKIETLLRLA
jgi:PTH1 family peptidyl-tRNA hydrolase